MVGHQREAAVDALNLEASLRHALDHGEGVVHYQPICGAGTKQLVGVEALARWRHPTLGTIPPSVFITAAERAGLIRKLGMLVLHTACAQAREWREHAPELTLSVNASVEELCDRRFLRDVEGVLAATGFDPRQLQLEVTESVFLHQPELGAEVLRGLRSLGIRVALDDFGMGYSSLGYLSRYPVDTLKIDRTFVAGMLDDANARAVVAAIQQLGQAMQLHVVAEGVEEEAQLEVLQDIGCLLVQGYLLGQPVPGEEMAAALRARAGVTQKQSR